MPGWDDLPTLIGFEGIQLVEEGIEPAAANAAMETARKRLADGADETQVWAAFKDLPRRKDFRFEEPSDLAGIRKSRRGGGKKSKLDLSDEVLLDKMYGAWLGRCAGCALGKPVEPFMGSRNGIPSWQRQKKYLTTISPSEWPLKDYYPQHSP